MKTLTLALADDHGAIRQSLTNFLSPYAHVLYSVSNGKDLTDLLAESHVLPDLCILDLDMPIMNGFITAQKIRKNWPDITVVIYSGNLSLEIRDALKQHGITHCYQKGADIKQLLAVVKGYGITVT